MTESTSPRRRNLRAVPALLLPAIVAGTLAACGSTVTSAPATPCPSPSCPATASPASAPSPSTAANGTLRMISRNGHRLAFHITAGHLPAIVLDAGGGLDSSYWNPLVPQLAKATGSEIITYDRAGLGDSDEVPGAWNVEDAVADLATGLRELGATQVILVAHSQAGEVATYFTRANPRQVCGAVLVDASLPNFYTDDEIARIEAANQPQIDALKRQPSTKQTRQLLATAANYGPMHHAYHQISWPDSIPATIIVSQKTPFDGSTEDAQRWRDAAAEFAKAGSNRQLVTAAASSHDVPIDRPDLVLDEIEKMAAAHG